MSTFCIQAKSKKTGIVYKVLCRDDYFGSHKYGYIVQYPLNPDHEVLTEEQFDERFTKVETNA